MAAAKLPKLLDPIHPFGVRDLSGREHARSSALFQKTNFPKIDIWFYLLFRYYMQAQVHVHNNNA